MSRDKGIKTTWAPSRRSRSAGYRGRAVDTARSVGGFNSRAKTKNRIFIKSSEEEEEEAAGLSRSKVSVASQINSLELDGFNVPPPLLLPATAAEIMRARQRAEERKEQALTCRVDIIIIARMKCFECKLIFYNREVTVVPLVRMGALREILTHHITMLCPDSI